jgi:hypothetical protein
VFLTLKVNITRVSDNRGHSVEIIELNLLIHEGCEQVPREHIHDCSSHTVRFRNLTLTSVKCCLLSLMKCVLYM